jgi:hypothetical protein
MLAVVLLEDIVPAEYLLRKIDKYIDFESICDKVRKVCGCFRATIKNFT